MECKYVAKGSRNATDAPELIDTLWNVNQRHLPFMHQMPLELIDTLWNVNTDDASKALDQLGELIDTLWNVNMHPIRERLAHGR